VSQLTIFKASAGSGKTFRLVVEYLKLLVKNPFSYKHILAVTFTNKATSEMKERILRDLYAVASGTNDKLLVLLTIETGLKAIEITSNAKQALSLILHDYDRFSVSTIDSFFQGILRSFARESGLYGSYEIDLDQDSVLMEACDQMLMSVENDPELRDWLLMMSENQLEEGKNWQIREKIAELGRELNNNLFKQYQIHQGSLSEERAKLKHLKTELIKIRKGFESECHKLGAEGHALMSKHGLSLNDFKYKGASFANAFNKLLAFKGGELSLGVRFLNAPDNPDAWPSTKESAAAVNNCYHDGMNDLVRRIIHFVDKSTGNYYTATEIYKNIYALGVLSTLSIFVRDVGQENNSLLLSESDTLLRGIIGNNDTPFIYEKAGNFYNYFMIDEFQDTSVIQWENFKPLVVNSMAENHPNLVVGDVKQSIYRWRSSDWQLLGSRLKEELKLFSVEEKNLDSNWRSSKNIVEFNNSFFNQSAKILQNTYNKQSEQDQAKPLPEGYGNTITEAFSDVIQSASSGKDDGYIRVQLIDSEDKAEYRKETISSLICEIERLQDTGYRASDIAILIRKNSQGNEVADALLNHRKKLIGSKYNFEVISDDSLFLGSSLTVRFLTGLFKFIIAPWDQVVRTSVVFQYSQYILPLLRQNGINPARIVTSGQQTLQLTIQDRAGKHFISTEIESDYFPFFSEDGGKTITKRWSAMSIIDLEQELEILYRLGDLAGEQASLQAFRDVVFEFSKKEGGNLHKFLEWWNQNGNKAKVQTAIARDAIRIISIHKSKGLEFPVVLIPFCDWMFEPDARKSNILWCPTENSTFSGFPALPVNYSKILQKTIFAPSYYTEMLLSYIDNLNLLYVAFTRAIDGLYIFSESSDKGNTVCSLLTQVLSDENDQPILQKHNDFLFDKGKLPPSSGIKKIGNEVNLSGRIEVKKQIGESLRLHKNYDGFLEDGGVKKALRMNEGKLMHELLSMIKTRNDIDTSLQILVRQGKMATGEIETIKAKLELLMQNPEAIPWFDGTYRVMNETTIITPGFNLKRPDRIMISENEAIIVDYKTSSAPSDEHRQQVKRYVDKVKEMGFTHVTGFVWYLNTDRLLNIEESFKME
jgi:ATP-dependent helicase/nuclease subunit A